MISNSKILSFPLRFFQFILVLYLLFYFLFFSFVCVIVCDNYQNVASVNTLLGL